MRTILREAAIYLEVADAGTQDKPTDDLKAYGFIASAKAMHDILTAAGVKGKYIVMGHDWSVIL